MSENIKTTGGAANSFHTGFLRENLVGQQFKGSKVISVTNKYITTEDERYLKKGLHITFKVIKPDAQSFTIRRRD